MATPEEEASSMDGGLDHSASLDPVAGEPTSDSTPASAQDDPNFSSSDSEPEDAAEGSLPPRRMTMPRNREQVCRRMSMGLFVLRIGSRV